MSARFVSDPFFIMPRQGLIKLSGVFMLVLYTALVDANFYPVDLDNFTQNGHPDASKLDSAQYFRQWLKEWYNPVATEITRFGALSSWDFETNITKETEADTVKQAQQSATFSKTLAKMIVRFNVSGMPASEEQLRRLRKDLSELGDSALDPVELSELTSTVNHMSSVYSTAKICFDAGSRTSVAQLRNLTGTGQCPEEMRVAYDPVVLKYMQNSWNDTERRKYAWTAWRDASGKTIRANYTRYVELKNKGARLSGYADCGALWRSNYVVEGLNYTDAKFLEDLERLWQQIRPLYLELHAFVRRKLINKFPTDNLSPTGPVPAHMMGDMFSQAWQGMLNFTQLFPSKPLLDVTEEMKRQNYTVEKMFRLSDQFQTELGLIPMPPGFWNQTVYTKPKDRDIVCHASAWDFYTVNPDDVRIKMCTEIEMDDLITIHHEMGHIQYFLQYSTQSLVAFREGANSGFHEAVGDTLALSVKTPKHLSWLGLLKNNTEDEDSDLNFMFVTALEKIAFLPFAYAMDRYRYDVFSGNISTEQLNSGWWNYVTKYQGLVAGVNRSEADFDAGSKFHIAADVEYMRYFISFVIQFQFHKALCHAAGHTGLLYQCDINQSKAAGKLLSEMLSLGSSEPWPVAMQRITGSPQMDAGALLEFFSPLLKFLQEANAKNKEKIGWD
ncbi:angiotensin-converting enzyme-like [Paramacrobiotus metropolitanus]|uniref:angiotensin-converting enzyme-like n=1 Tax=Paramacrobiotus metropolitanus TaxID=2943436 RepID=UPI0024464BFB|nr:angiotensin-converting enzyme-like [Paramacrobiotus metropolitanus]